MPRRFAPGQRKRWPDPSYGSLRALAYDEPGPQEDEVEADERELFEREARFARASGDPRWGTGGMPVDDRPFRRLPSREPHGWPAPHGYRDLGERQAYEDWEAFARFRPGPGEAGEPPSRGPYVGRGPRGYRRSDERILEDVCERFTEHGHLDPSDVEVSVRSGEVVLSGTVATRAEKRLAEDIADVVPGVVEVHNRLRVQRVGEAGRPPAGQPAVNGTMDR